MTFGEEISRADLQLIGLMSISQPGQQLQKNINYLI